MRFISTVLLTIDGAGLLGLLVTLASSSSDAPIWIGLLVLAGMGIGFGWALKRAGRPGIACLPLALVLPVSLYGLAIGLFILSGPHSHH